jgi:hypothetical protein
MKKNKSFKEDISSINDSPMFDLFDETSTERLSYVEEEKEDYDVYSIMEQPFNPKDIDIQAKTLAMYNIIQRLKEDEIDLSPNFQRNRDLWDGKTQSRLIESLLINFPLPAFYFDGTDDEKWLVVDGLQRLSSIRNFVVTEELVLSGMEFLTNLNGKHYSELSRIHQRQINEAEIIAYIINPGTPPDVKFNIFKRINTGGLVLSPQEIRHALNQGKPAEFVSQLAENEYFKKATGGLDTKRMLDREFVTRFLAFYIHSPNEYKPDMDTFMNRTMEQLKGISKSELDHISYSFTEAMKLSMDVFDKWAFRKVYNKNDHRSPINKALFEVWSVIFAKLTDLQREVIRQKRNELFESFVQLLASNKAFSDAISTSTGSKNRVLERFEKVEQLVNRVMSI